MALRTPSPPNYSHVLRGKPAQMQNQPQVVWAQQPQQGSLLHELYSDSDVYQDEQTGHTAFPDEGHHHMPRRATYPYVRAEREEIVNPTPYPPPYVSDELVNPFAAAAVAQRPSTSSSSSSDGVYPQVDSFLPHHQVKLEPEYGIPHAALPQHLQPPPLGHATPNYYRPPPPPQVQYQQYPAHHMSYPHPQQGMNPYHNSLVPGMPLPTSLAPHSGLPIQHTDDAASKETQYLRRRCFNCHTTEPPSWRRSTLNPGKIVCNKCGLYERTHLRPRPLRFDELRAGNKARKAAAAAAAAAGGGAAPTGPGPLMPSGNKSPKSAATSAKSSPVLQGANVKKEPRDYPITRRSSVSSVNGGSSDWDDNVSLYSGSSSASSSAYGSPATNTYPIPRSSHSPVGSLGIDNIDMSLDQQRLTMNGTTSAIRLPNASLTDLMPDSSLADDSLYRRATLPA